MSVLVSIFVGGLGLVFGSFLNVCISRLPQHESVLLPGSHCPSCHRPVRMWDNIPVLSFLLLGGRCRDCHRAIGWRYPLVELTTAMLFLLSAWTFGLTLTGIATMLLCFLLLGLAVMDAETLTLPDTFTLAGIALGLIYHLATPGLGAGERLLETGIAALWGILFGVLLLLVRWVYYLLRRQEGLGLGDAKLMAMVAVWLSPALTAEALFVGVVAAAIFGAGWLLLHPREGMRAMLPLGTFLCAATLLVLFKGQPLLKWYMHFYR
jgi:leader peptidase (prepilin peptidase)/N-methyltransferase